MELSGKIAGNLIIGTYTSVIICFYHMINSPFRYSQIKDYLVYNFHELYRDIFAELMTPRCLFGIFRSGLAVLRTSFFANYPCICGSAIQSISPPLKNILAEKTSSKMRGAINSPFSLLANKRLFVLQFSRAFQRHFAESLTPPGGCSAFSDLG